MLARAVKGLPAPSSVRGGLSYEPKWDGFRCIVFRDGDEVELASRNLKPITRYFPEVVAAVLAETPRRCVLDGEIVLARGGRLDFEALQQRIHPADSRVRRLAAETPAALVVFDVLAIEDEDLQREPHAARRESLLRLGLHGPGVFTTPATRDAAVAAQWFATFEGAGLDGVVAKPLEGAYAPGARTMLKIKHERTADCVLAGYRLHTSSTPTTPLLGSLLLGLYDDAGTLQSVGVAASFPMARRASLIKELAPLRTGVADHPWADWSQAGGRDGSGVDGSGVDASMGQRRPGAVSRWNAGKDLSFVALRPERVVEVAYDHMEGTRFRHTTQFRRWREDRDPASCTYAQLEEPVKYDLATLLPGAEQPAAGAPRD
jgi:ATP-dependent DNA ligase